MIELQLERWLAVATATTVALVHILLNVVRDNAAMTSFHVNAALDHGDGAVNPALLPLLPSDQHGVDLLSRQRVVVGVDAPDELPVVAALKLTEKNWHTLLL